MFEQRKACKDCSVGLTQSPLKDGSDFVFTAETSILATALVVFDTMLVGQTKFLARFRILSNSHMQKHSLSG